MIGIQLMGIKGITVPIVNTTKQMVNCMVFDDQHQNNRNYDAIQFDLGNFNNFIDIKCKYDENTKFYDQYTMSRKNKQ